MKIYVERIINEEHPLEIWYGTDKENLNFHYTMSDLRFKPGTIFCDFCNNIEPNHLIMDQEQYLMFIRIINQIIVPFLHNKININFGINEFTVENKENDLHD